MPTMDSLLSFFKNEGLLRLILVAVLLIVALDQGTNIRKDSPPAPTATVVPTSTPNYPTYRCTEQVIRNEGRYLVCEPIYKTTNR